MSKPLNKFKISKKQNIDDKTYSLWLSRGYPFARLFIKPKALIHELRKYKPKISYEKFDYLYKKELPLLTEYRFRNQYISIFIPLDHYNKLDIIVDYYTEKSRLKCTLKNKKSPYNLILKYGLLEYTLKNMISKNKKITYESYRDEIYNYPGIYIC